MSCDCNIDGLMPLEQAKQTIWQTVRQVEEIQDCPLEEALGRVLAKDIVSPVNVPPSDNSAMDGYAIRYQDLATTSHFNLVGKSFAGQPCLKALGPGECVRIMTGANIPDGADTIVIQENVNADGTSMVIRQSPKAGNAIRSAGEDIPKGARVFTTGRLVTATDIGLLASLGIERVPVFRKLRVAVFSTGDELVQPGTALQDGQIFDSNRPALVAMLRKLGVDIIDLGIITDNKQDIRRAFQEANHQADVVVSSGGVSVGEADFTKEILDEMGQIEFWKLAIKPGKPLAFGRLSDSVFFGLPGNPVSAMVTFHQIAVPTLRLMMGQTPSSKTLFQALANSTFKKRPGRTDFQRGVCWRDEKGQLMVEPTGSQGSGILSSFSNSNCYAVLEKERGDVQCGERVTVELFDSIIAH
ncbi:molybdopterin molybdotransferase MoeA [Aestuariibacter halophilus]|uniref:Molybdopterin molybdenumtransferase n=1 Tax=Fluctibacter halophilus TaxID=226011 RepID=A0ABS8G3A3_9ALTE|nr:molybdopterin molybdotransferase MoeA [Aestuariibacter halophilus]MCC2615062.1 molybdopterin molybdotransferase MoeA [Aestuariibacter halophilus]